MTTKTTGGIVVATTVAAALLFGLGGVAQAQAPERDRVIRPAPKSVQKNVVQKRAPTRIIVRPRHFLLERLDSTEFPRSDYLGYPGRNAVRQCTSWLATEYRPSGTVVTPQMRCWWERG